jgi:hypothetical protein
VKRTITIVLVAFAGCVAVAHAATMHKPYVLKHGTTCRIKGYHTHVVKKHGPKIIKCEWDVSRKIVVPGPPVPATVVEPTLAVSLDPSFTQDPANPLDVTYAYSASATENGVSLNKQASLPSGVLEFFDNGQLVCSTAVGGDTTGGTCEVLYTAYGDQAVDVVYDSGSSSTTTGDETETIVPPATYSTTTTLAVGAQTTNGSYPVTATVVDSNNNPVTSGTVQYVVSIAWANNEDRESAVVTGPANSTCDILVTQGLGTNTNIYTTTDSPECAVTQAGDVTDGASPPTLVSVDALYTGADYGDNITWEYLPSTITAPGVVLYS